MWRSGDRKVVAHDNPSGYGVAVVRISDAAKIARPQNIVRSEHLTAARKEELASAIAVTERWPDQVGGKEEAKAWDKWWTRVKHDTMHENSSRMKKGEISQAHVQGQCWMGGLDKATLKMQGCQLVRGAVDEEACELLEGHIRAGETARLVENLQVHRDVDPDAKVRAVPYQLPPDYGGPVKAPPGMLVPKEAEVNAALARVCDDVAKAAGLDGKKVGRPSQVEGLYPAPRKVLPPQKMHGDYLGNPTLGAVVCLSEQGPGPYFPDLLDPWGTGGKMGREQVEGLSYAEARKARWDLVREQNANPSNTLAARSAEGGQLGFTRQGNASAVRRCNGVGEETSLNPRGSERPQLSRGDVVFFDVTGPHCGPGVTEAERKKGRERTVLYLSWVGQAAMEEGGGAPCYARPVEEQTEYDAVEAPGGTYHCVYDSDGRYRLTVVGVARGPSRGKRKGAPGAGSSGGAASSGTLEQDAAAVLASLAKD